MMKSLKILAVAAVMMFGIGTASAVPLSGTLDITGASTLLKDDGFGGTVGAGAADAEGVDFGSAVVVVSTGDFAGFDGFLSPVTMNADPFFFAGPQATALPTLFFTTSGGVTFTLNSVAISTQDATGFILTGSGVASAAGFDNTNVSWSFSSQTGGLSFSSSIAASEPGTLALIGAGLLALGVARRRKAQAAA